MSSTLCPAVTCRRVGLNRIDDLLALETACFSADRILRRNLRRLLVSPTAYCLGAYRSGRLVGSMIVLFRRNSRKAWIYSLAVSSELRGMGIGRRLMARAEQEVRRRGCSHIRLEVRMDNFSALRMYEQSGYVYTAVIPGYYADGTHAFVMNKELS
ncbi:MAG TPA: GNAT family N-acetyltransferase [Pontiella sp.]